MSSDRAASADSKSARKRKPRGEGVVMNSGGPEEAKAVGPMHDLAANGHDAQFESTYLKDLNKYVR